MCSGFIKRNNQNNQRMSQRLIFKHIDKIIEPIKSWTVRTIEDVNIDVNLLLKFDSIITMNIQKMSKVLIEFYTTLDDEKIKLNILCYDIEYLIQNSTGYPNGKVSCIYIPCEKLNLFIREQKLKRILNDNR
jgi:hypothetical protein